jgi:hypothetical protein
VNLTGTACNFMLGYSRAQVLAYCKDRGWKVYLTS